MRKTGDCGGRHTLIQIHTHIQGHKNQVGKEQKDRLAKRYRKRKKHISTSH